MSSLFAGSSDELFYMLCVNETGRIKQAQLVSKGVGDSVLATQRDIVKMAINSNARGVILVHNHVTEFSTPSQDDIRSTKAIQKTLEAVNIQLIDHFVVTSRECVSILQDARYKFMK